MSSREQVLEGPTPSGPDPVCGRLLGPCLWGVSSSLFPGLLPLSSECNTSLCKEKPPLCALGFDVKSEMVPGRCCPVYSCGKWARG